MWAALALGGALALLAPSGSAAATGAWERAWGKDVVSGGGTGFEFCVAAENCKVGEIGGLGGEMEDPFGVATDASGNVYVSDEENHRIQKFDSAGNWERAWGKDVVSGGGTGFEVCTAAAGCKVGEPGSLGGEMSLPLGIATDASGNVFVVETDPTGNFNKNRIQKFDSDGNWERAWGKDVIAGGGTSFEICTTAADCQGGSSGGLGGEMFFPTGLDTDGSGNVYAADQRNIRIQKFDSDGNWERAWGRDVIQSGETGDLGDVFEICTIAADCKQGSGGSLGGEMSMPTGVATDASGSVYLADQTNFRIQKFDTNGAWERAWGKDVVSGGGTGFEICTNAMACQHGDPGSLGGEMRFPVDVATDAWSDVYVGDSTNLRIQKFGSNGGWERTWGKDVVSGGGTGFEICTNAMDCKEGDLGGLGGEMGPAGVDTGALGDVYVADGPNDRIQKFADPPLLLPPPPTTIDLPPPYTFNAFNDFVFDRLRRNTKKGIAFLFVTVPGPGEVGLAGKGVKDVGIATASARKSVFTPGGRVKLRIKPAKKGKRASKVRRALKKKGRAKVKVWVTYVPTGGLANTQARKVKLVRKR